MYDSGRHGLLCLLLSIASARKDCTFWSSMNDCTSFTPCFWHSKAGTCNNINEWSKTKGSHTGPMYGDSSPCTGQRDMFACYSYMNCFWQAHKGSCEDVSYWSLINVDPAVDPKTRPCGFWENSQDCWGIEKCFFDRRTNTCKEISSHSRNKPAQPQPNMGSHTSPNQPIHPQTHAGGQAQPNHSASDPYTNPRFHNPPASPGPYDNPYSPPPIYNPISAYNNPNGYNGYPMNHPGAPQGSGYQNQYYPGYQYDSGARATFPPSFSPTDFWEPMNLCESHRDRKTCAYGSGCIWDIDSRRCFDSMGDCNAFRSPGMCFKAEECTWDRTNKKCQSGCATIGEEAPCVYSEECFWDQGECLALNVACNRLSTPSLCVHNEMCFWNTEVNECKSFFTNCEAIDSDASCGMNEQCLWNDQYQQCENLYKDPSNAPPPFVNCEDIADVEVCWQSNSTEHNMPCEWDKRQNKCVEFDFDCESFETRDTCDGARFRDIVCYWKGECDQRKLFTPANHKHQKLQRIRHSELTETETNEFKSSSFVTRHMTLFVFIAAAFVGLSCGWLLISWWKTTVLEDLAEPLDVAITHAAP